MHPSNRSRVRTAPGLPVKCIEELELRPGERDLVAFGGYQPARAGVEPPTGELAERPKCPKRPCPGPRPGAGGRRPAQQRLDPGQELAGIERLGDVVVGSDLEPHDPVDVVGASGHEDDAHIVARTDEPGEVQTVLSRQIDVEEHEIHGIVGQDPAQSPAVGRLGDPVPGRFQIARELRPGNVVVLDDQHMGGVVRQCPTAPAISANGPRGCSAVRFQPHCALPGIQSGQLSRCFRAWRELLRLPRLFRISSRGHVNMF